MESSSILAADGVTLLALLLVGVVLLLASRRLLVGLAYRLHLRGASRPALGLARLLLRLPDPTSRLAGAWLLAAVRADRGETSAAMEAVDLLLEVVGVERLSWRLVADVSNHLVNAGLYREAVSLPRRWPARWRHAGRRRSPAAYAIAQTNRAEALHNLGRDRLALCLLDRVEAKAEGNSLAEEGLACLRAWICTHTGDLETAASELARVGGGDFASRYAPELCYARARLELGRRRLDVALGEVERGLERSRRAASRRNGLFLLGEIWMEQGETARARDGFERGLGEPYRAQGGPSLLRYAALLDAGGQQGEAERLYRLLLERDPQSWAAAAARSALQDAAREMGSVSS